MSEQPQGGPSKASSAPVCFGSFEFDPETSRLTRNGVARRLENQPAIILIHLITHRDRLVLRDELIARLWPGEVHGDFDHRLNKAIAKLRFALNDRSATPKFIDTVRGRGWKFLAEVTPVERPSAPVDPPQEPDAGDPELPVAIEEPMAPALSQETSSALRGWTYLSVAAAVVLCAGSGWLLYAHRHAAAAALPRTGGMRSVAVVGMRPTEGPAEANWISRSMAAWLNDDLAAQGKLRVLTGAQLEEMAGSFPSWDDGGLPAATLTAIRQKTGADLAVFGKYAVRDADGSPQWEVELWAQDTLHPASVQRATALGPQSSGPAMLQQIEEQLAARLGLGHAAQTENPGMEQSPLPEDAQAARLYSEGILALRRRDWVEAGALLTQARDRAPRDTGTNAALASALLALGDRDKATQAYETAMHNARSLSPLQQAELWALRCKITDDWPTVATLYAQLAQKSPSDMRYLLEKAGAEIHRGAASAALNTLHGVATQPGVGLYDAEADWLRAQAEGRTGDFHAQLEAAKQARADAEATGQTLLMASAATQQGAAAFDLGRWDEADAAWKKAFDIFALASDRAGMGEVLYGQGRLFWARHQPTEARQALERSIDLMGSADSGTDLAAAYVMLANVRLYNKSDPLGATAVVTSLLAKATEIDQRNNDLAGQGKVLGLLGDMKEKQGQFMQARVFYQQALDFSSRADDRSAVAGRFLDLGINCSELGDNAGAETYYTRSIEAYRALGQRDRMSLSEDRLANVLFREDQLDRAIALSRDALSTMQSIGIVDNGIMEDLSRFELERDPAMSEKLARASLEASTDMVDPRGLGSRYMILAQAQLAEGKDREARQSIDHAFELRPVLADRPEASEMYWVRAKVSMREKDMARARADAQKALDIAEHFGSKRWEMPARLQLAEIDLALHAPSARTGLQHLEQDSERLGYLYIARKARTDLAAVPRAA